jgi:hypothetical protein
MWNKYTTWWKHTKTWHMLNNMIIFTINCPPPHSLLISSAKNAAIFEPPGPFAYHKVQATPKGSVVLQFTFSGDIWRMISTWIQSWTKLKSAIFTMVRTLPFEKCDRCYIEQADVILKNDDDFLCDRCDHNIRACLVNKSMPYWNGVLVKCHLLDFASYTEQIVQLRRREVIQSVYVS